VSSSCVANFKKKKGSCVARNSKTSLRRAVASHGFHDQRQVLGKKKKKQIMRHPGSRKPQDRFGKASLGHKKQSFRTNFGSKNILCYKEWSRYGDGKNT
jgi:hypothetical protein